MSFLWILALIAGVGLWGVLWVTIRRSRTGVKILHPNSSTVPVKNAPVPSTPKAAALKDEIATPVRGTPAKQEPRTPSIPKSAKKRVVSGAAVSEPTDPLEIQSAKHRAEMERMKSKLVELERQMLALHSQVEAAGKAQSLAERKSAEYAGAALKADRLQKQLEEMERQTGARATTYAENLERLQAQVSELTQENQRQLDVVRASVQQQKGVNASRFFPF